MVEYLADVVEIDPRKRTVKQWQALGKHHAQALVARHLRSMPSHQWAAYRRGVMAGAQHEYERTKGTPEGRYWWSFVWSMELMPRPVWLNAMLRRVV